MYYYKVYSFTIQVPFAIDELISIPSQLTDIIIQEEPVSPTLKNISSQGEFFNGHIEYQISENKEILLFIKDIGYYHIYNKNTVTIQRLEGVSNEDISLYLLGFCFGFIVSLHETFALHGSAVGTSEGCIMFVGESGAGKSTTAAQFVQRGFNLIADDVCVIHFDKDDQGQEKIYVQPAYPQLKLWGDSAEQLNYATEELKTVSDTWNKYRVPSKDIFQAQACPLKAIYFLEPTENELFKIYELKGFDKVLACTQNTYNRRATLLLGLEQQHFEFCTKIASKIPIRKIERGNNFEHIKSMVDKIKITSEI